MVGASAEQSSLRTIRRIRQRRCGKIVKTESKYQFHFVQPRHLLQENVTQLIPSLKSHMI
jgi:hypothetical protein